MCGLKQSPAGVCVSSVKAKVSQLSSDDKASLCPVPLTYHSLVFSLRHKDSTMRFLPSACVWLRRTACSTSSTIVTSVLKGDVWRLRSCANGISYSQLEDPSRVSSWQESEIHSNCWNVHVLSKAILTSWGVNNHQAVRTAEEPP